MRRAGWRKRFERWPEPAPLADPKTHKIKRRVNGSIVESAATAEEYAAAVCQPEMRKHDDGAADREAERLWKEENEKAQAAYRAWAKGA